MKHFFRFGATSDVAAFNPESRLLTFLVENELDDYSNPQSERDTLDVHCNFWWPGRRHGKLASIVTSTIYIVGERRFLILAEKTQMWNFIGSDTKARILTGLSQSSS